jgi:hypothetical protein
MATAPIYQAERPTHQLLSDSDVQTSSNEQIQSSSVLNSLYESYQQETQKPNAFNSLYESYQQEAQKPQKILDSLYESYQEETQKPNAFNSLYESYQQETQKSQKILNSLYESYQQETQKSQKILDSLYESYQEETMKDDMLFAQMDAKTEEQILADEKTIYEILQKASIDVAEAAYVFANGTAKQVTAFCTKFPEFISRNGRLIAKAAVVLGLAGLAGAAVAATGGSALAFYGAALSIGGQLFGQTLKATVSATASLVGSRFGTGATFGALGQNQRIRRFLLSRVPDWKILKMLHSIGMAPPPAVTVQQYLLDLTVQGIPAAIALATGTIIPYAVGKGLYYGVTWTVKGASYVLDKSVTGIQKGFQGARVAKDKMTEGAFKVANTIKSLLSGVVSNTSRAIVDDKVTSDDIRFRNHEIMEDHMKELLPVEQQAAEFARQREQIVGDEIGAGVMEDELVDSGSVLQVEPKVDEPPPSSMFLPPIEHVSSILASQHTQQMVSTTIFLMISVLTQNPELASSTFGSTFQSMDHIFADQISKAITPELAQQILYSVIIQTIGMDKLAKYLVPEKVQKLFELNQSLKGKPDATYTQKFLNIMFGKQIYTKDDLKMMDNSQIKELLYQWVDREKYPKNKTREQLMEDFITYQNVVLNNLAVIIGKELATIAGTSLTSVLLQRVDMPGLVTKARDIDLKAGYTALKGGLAGVITPLFSGDPYKLQKQMASHIAMGRALLDDFEHRGVQVFGGDMSDVNLYAAKDGLAQLLANMSEVADMRGYIGEVASARTFKELQDIWSQFAKDTFEIKGIDKLAQMVKPGESLPEVAQGVYDKIRGYLDSGKQQAEYDSLMSHFDSEVTQFKAQMRDYVKYKLQSQKDWVQGLRAGEGTPFHKNPLEEIPGLTGSKRIIGQANRLIAEKLANTKQLLDGELDKTVDAVMRMIDMEYSTFKSDSLKLFKENGATSFIQIAQNFVRLSALKEVIDAKLSTFIENFVPLAQVELDKLTAKLARLTRSRLEQGVGTIEMGGRVVQPVKQAPAQAQPQVQTQAPTQAQAQPQKEDLPFDEESMKRLRDITFVPLGPAALGDFLAKKAVEGMFVDPLVAVGDTLVSGWNALFKGAEQAGNLRVIGNILRKTYGEEFVDQMKKQTVSLGEFKEKYGTLTATLAAPGLLMENIGAAGYNKLVDQMFPKEAPDILNFESYKLTSIGEEIASGFKKPITGADIVSYLSRQGAFSLATGPWTAKRMMTEIAKVATLGIELSELVNQGAAMVGAAAGSAAEYIKPK